MPRAKQIGKTEEFLRLSQASSAIAEYNDCAVISVAAVTGADYATVHTMMNALGRKPKHGTPMWITERALNQLGFRFTAVDPFSIIATYPGGGKGFRSVTTHHPDRFRKQWPAGRYLLRTRGHILAVVDGVNHDWTRGRSKRVLQILKIEKA